jgi:hypothetical protein
VSPGIPDAAQPARMHGVSSDDQKELAKLGYDAAIMLTRSDNMIDDQARTCEHCVKPLKRTQKRFCSRACSTAHRQPTIKEVWVAHFARERGTTPWPGPGLNHKSVCGTKIVDQEEIMVEAGDLPAASELCAQCEKLFDQESRRRLAQAYGILLGLANSRGQLLSALAACRRERGLRQVSPLLRRERQLARLFCPSAGSVAPCLPVQWRRLGACNGVAALLHARLVDPGRG